MKFTNKIQTLNNDTNSDNPEIVRKKRLLNTLLAGTFFSAVLGAIITGILLILKSVKFENVSLLLISCLVFLGISIGLYYLNKQKGLFASWLFLILFTIALAFSDTPSEVSNGRSLFVFAIPIAIASLLLKSHVSFWFATLSTAIVLIISYSILRIPNIPGIISFYMLALTSWLSARSLEHALRDLRAINTNLDELVEQKTQELATTLSRELILAGRNQAILDSIADGVIVFDANHVSILANPALSQIIETSVEDLKGINLANFVKTEELSPANQGIIMQMIENPVKFETGIQVEWGKKTLSVSVARVRNSETNQNIGAVAVIRDVTREAELEKMKSTFVAVVSHELRTPLNAVMGYAELLQELVLGPINEKQSEAIDRIMVNLKRLLLMVGDLLDEAQIKAGKLSIKKQEFKVASLLENLHATMYKIAIDQGLYLALKIDPNMPKIIIGDQQRLQQILLNLVNNSIKFTRTGGVDVQIALADENHWEIEVADSGTGIPESEISNIFETFRQVENFTTRQHQGFGLGLSIVKQLVELQDGKISVKSELNKGSVFTVNLPLLPLKFH